MYAQISSASEMLIHTIRDNYTIKEAYLTIYQTNSLPKEVENN